MEILAELHNLDMICITCYFPYWAFTFYFHVSNHDCFILRNFLLYPSMKLLFVDNFNMAEVICMNQFVLNVVSVIILNKFNSSDNNALPFVAKISHIYL